MVLIECPECCKSVSDAAKSCPSCGVSIRNTFLGKFKNDILNKIDVGISSAKRRIVFSKLEKQLLNEWSDIAKRSGVLGNRAPKEGEDVKRLTRLESYVKKSIGDYIFSKANPSVDDIMSWMKSFERIPVCETRSHGSGVNNSWSVSTLIIGCLCSCHALRFSEFFIDDMVEPGPEELRSTFFIHLYVMSEIFSLSSSFNPSPENSGAELAKRVKKYQEDEEFMKVMSRESVKSIYEELLLKIASDERDSVLRSAIFDEWESYVGLKGNHQSHINETFLEMVFASLLFEGEEWELGTEYWKHVEKVNPELFEMYKSFPFKD